MMQNALQLMNTGDFSNAKTILVKLSHYLPNHPDTWQLLASAQAKTNDHKAAESSFNKSLRLNPNQTNTLNNLGNLHKQTGNTKKAIDAYSRALTLDASNVNALCNLGLIFTESDSEKAEHYFQQALKVKSNDLNSLFGMAVLKKQRQEYTAALEYYTKVLSIAPNNVRAIHNKAVIHKILGEWEESKTLLDEVIEVLPNNVDVLHNMGSVQNLLGKTEESISTFKKAIEIAPNNLEIHHWLNDVMWGARHTDFLASYKSSLSANPSNSDLRLAYVQKLCKVESFDEALAELEVAIKYDKNRPDVHIARANAFNETLQFEKSIDAANQAKKLLKHNDDVAHLLAKNHLGLGDASQALSIYEALIRKKPLHQGYWAMKATALRMLNKDEYFSIYDYNNLVMTVDIEVPNGYRNIKEFNEELYSVLQKYHTAKGSPLDQSLKNGTQTSEQLFNHKDNAITLLHSAFKKNIDEHLNSLNQSTAHPLLSRLKDSFYHSGSWSVILNKSGFHKNHYHTEGWYSGPYYVKLPEGMNTQKCGSGWIKFGEPGFRSLEPLGPDLLVRPKEGMMVLFPSYMWHGTVPFETNEERVTVAHDILPK